MNFDFTAIESVSFGVGSRRRSEVEFRDVPIDLSVSHSLKEMVRGTVKAMQEVAESPSPYEPSQRYSPLEHLSIHLDDPMAVHFVDLSKVTAFEPGGAAVLREPRLVFCYVGRFIDQNHRTLFGVRRATSFKGVLKKKHLVLPLVSDELRMVEDHLFRLDVDFDVLIDDQQVCILHTVGFEAIGKLHDVIKNAAVGNIQTLQNNLPFIRIAEVDTSNIKLTVARQLSSVSQQPSRGITLSSLRKACDDNGVAYSVVGGKLEFGNDSVSDLLDILDRRLYVDNLVPGAPMRYRASNRNPRI